MAVDRKDDAFARTDLEILPGGRREGRTRVKASENF